MWVKYRILNSPVFLKSYTIYEREICSSFLLLLLLLQDNKVRFSTDCTKHLQLNLFPKYDYIPQNLLICCKGICKVSVTSHVTYYIYMPYRPTGFLPPPSSFSFSSSIKLRVCFSYFRADKFNDFRSPCSS